MLYVSVTLICSLFSALTIDALLASLFGNDHTRFMELLLFEILHFTDVKTFHRCTLVLIKQLIFHYAGRTLWSCPDKDT